MYYFINNAPCTSTAPIPGGVEISESQYNVLVKSIMSFDKTAPDGQYYQLQIDGSWELRDLPPAPPVEPDPDAEIREKAAAYDILMGGA